MRSEFVFAVLVLIVAVVGVRIIERREAGGVAASVETVPAEKDAERLAAYYGAVHDEVRISPGSHNQFFVTAAVNRNPASFLVDTGASYVALRESDALASGVYTKQADYSHSVRTANGETRAALVTLQSMEIGPLRVDGVKAFILPDDQLAINLLGMSFLSKLESVEARGGELVLKG